MRCVDLHHHLLWAADDGPAHFSDACEMLKRAVADGTDVIVATPHVAPGKMAFDRAECLQKVEAANVFCRENGLPLLVLPGAEILYTDDTPAFLAQGLVPTLNDSRFALIEFKPWTPFSDILLAFLRVTDAGFFPILAHAERIDCLRDEPRRAAALKGKTGARIQMNAGALLHAPFSAERRFCRALLRNNLADCVASDAHNTTSRPPCLGRCRKALAGRLGEPDALRLTGGNQADWLGL